MKVLHIALLVGLLAGATGCSRQSTASAAPAPKAYDGPATRAYLFLVGQIRSQMNSDNKERLPALIRGADSASLDNQAHRTGVLKQSLAGFSTDKVDPDAVQFAQNVEGILDAYQSSCADSAELYREVAHEDEVLTDEKPRLTQLKLAMREPQGDTLGALGVLIDALERMGDTSKPKFMSTGGLLQKLKDDRDRLVETKENHHLFTLKVKSDFTQRYPAVDWKAKEILP